MDDKRTFHVDPEKAVDRYADMVYRLARLNTPSQQDAEDIFQEVFLKLIRHQKSIHSEEHLKAWLIRVTLNQCKSRAVLVWNKRRVSMDTVAELGTEEQEDYSEVYKAVCELPQKYREVIYLYYYEEYQVKEIAEILKCKEATVKTHLARARKLLGEQLKGEFGNG